MSEELAAQIQELQAPDEFLQMLVDWANLGMEFDIMLATGGLLISGRMIGYLEYIRSLEEQDWNVRFENPADEDTAGDAAKGFRDSLLKAIHEAGNRLQEKRDKRFENAGSDEEPEESTYAFINLRNARIVAADGSLLHHPLWRLRVSSVDGFSFGMLGDS